jgi:NitT/TauT family transport system ATP-binding protein
VPASGSLEVRGVTKKYSTPTNVIEALRDVSFRAEPSQVISIVGPSGCGKSTLLKIVAGLLPYEGEIEVNGEPLLGPRDDIGLMFQSPLLFPWRTVLKNVLLPARVHKRLTPKTEARARALLDLVGLNEFASHYPNELSGGMQQRAALCRALLEDPTILLLDEPFGALDELTREALNLVLLEIQALTHKTVILVTHSVQEAVFLSDRVLVMTARPGEIVEDLHIDLERPRHLSMTTNAQFGQYVSTIRRLLGIEDHHRVGPTASTREGQP